MVQHQHPRPLSLHCCLLPKPHILCRLVPVRCFQNPQVATKANNTHSVLTATLARKLFYQEILQVCLTKTFRLNFRRSLESGLCSSPKETAGRVTRWPCLWRNSKKLIYASPMSLEMKSDAKFLVYLAYITRPCLPKKFEFIVSSVHFCTLRNCYKFLRCSNGWLKVQAIILRKI